MGILDKFVGKPKPMTDDRKREVYMMSRYQLTRDPEEPFTYYLNNKFKIRFNPADPESVSNAEEKILEFYKNPQVEELTRDEQIVRAGTKQKGGKAGPDAWRDIGQLGDNLNAASEKFFGDVDVPRDYDPLRPLPGDQNADIILPKVTPPKKKKTIRNSGQRDGK